MGYSEVADVRQALSENPDNSGTNTAADMPESAITDAIAEADSVINGFVGGAYAPGEWPAQVRYWSRDLAAYLATLTWRKSADILADDPVRLRQTLVMTQLAALAKGDITIPLPASQSTSGVAYVANQYTGNLFLPPDFDLDGNGVRSNKLKTTPPPWIEGSQGPKTWE